MESRRQIREPHLVEKAATKKEKRVKERKREKKRDRQWMAHVTRNRLTIMGPSNQKKSSSPK